MTRFGLFLLIAAASLAAGAQSSTVPVDQRTDHLVDRLDITHGDHRGMLQVGWKPYRRAGVVAYAAAVDSATANPARIRAFNLRYLYDDNAEYAGDLARAAERPILKWFYRESASLLHLDRPALDLRLDPVVHIELGAESGEEEFRYVNTRGAVLRGRIDRTVAFHLFATDNQGRFPHTVHDRSRARDGIMPGEGRAKSIRSDTLLFGEGGLDFFAVRGGIEFPATRHVQVRFAYDDHHVGNGYRSLVLDRSAAPFLALELRTRVWRIDYRNLFAELADYRGENVADSPIRKKYLAFHRLGINVGRAVNLGIFESVVFGPVDTTGRTGFELHYLNPIIFYRAIEFNLGSLDNVLLGVDWKVNFLRHGRFYGQFVLDELNVAKWREGDGWWANKFAFQAGLQYIDMFGLPGLDGRVEFNTARPFTYSHFGEVSNYGHFSQPLAHPLGANFREGIAVLRWQPVGRLEVELRAIRARYGTDADSTSFGGDIFRDNDAREGEFGHAIGQGVGTDLTILGLSAGWQLFHDLDLVVQAIRRGVDSEEDELDRTSTFVSAGVRWNIAERRWDF